MTVYQMIDVVGTSGTSVSDAIRGALERTSGAVEEIQWFEVKEIRGRVHNDEPEYQVKIQVGALLPAGQVEQSEVPASRKAGTRQTRSEAAQVAAKKGQKGKQELSRGFEKQPGGTTKGRTK